MRDLSPVQRALLAIVRAADEMQSGQGDGNGLLILDEPTPFLPRRDVDQLFRVVRDVVNTGASVIFVSHDVDEVLGDHRPSDRPARRPRRRAARHCRVRASKNSSKQSSAVVSR